ncbi:dynein light chain roadblock-type [Strigomonas culicis]|uniref:Dynein light chain roadblock-type n=1 Tax=Strigomonas culicis TaxID=28005 RepID=S9UGB7_9TRYP|nr:dynein light chain roadblock-type [Strigomonas culicis]EPY28763.1 dynein light chain roadblock-type [Strigomonas culicis]EPY35224.1 dynein light chain roadblock-type [Strigomonas culicis]|eukprot:EPY27794.1 dynein light chain roadblock-type [Strigomonas culicis]
MSSRDASEPERTMYVKNVEDTLKRIAGHKGVVGYYVTDPATGKVLKYAGFGDSSKEVHRYIDALKGFISLAASTVRTIDWSDEMSFLRLSYGAFDIMVAPDLEKQYTLVVVQHIE